MKIRASKETRSERGKSTLHVAGCLTGPQRAPGAFLNTREIAAAHETLRGRDKSCQFFFFSFFFFYVPLRRWAAVWYISRRPSTGDSRSYRLMGSATKRARGGGRARVVAFDLFGERSGIPRSATGRGPREEESLFTVGFATGIIRPPFFSALCRVSVTNGSFSEQHEPRSPRDARVRR